MSALISATPASRNALVEPLWVTLRDGQIDAIYVLDGGFADEFGEHRQGEIVLYQPGSEHTWNSAGGATLFVVWDGPTEALGRGA